MADPFTGATQSNTAAIMDVANQVKALGRRTVITKAGATASLTAAEVIDTLIRQSGNDAAQSTQLPTAAAIIAALGDKAAVGAVFEFMVENGNTSAGAVTLTTNTGLTLDVAAVPISKTRIFRGLVTSITAAAEAVVILGVGPQA